VAYLTLQDIMTCDSSMTRVSSSAPVRAHVTNTYAVMCVLLHCALQLPKRGCCVGHMEPGCTAAPQCIPGLSCRQLHTQVRRGGWQTRLLGQGLFGRAVSVMSWLAVALQSCAARQ
jgi:hypothetical protein